ncbi:TPA: hypothetical protein RG697_000063 [Morganella morganii]|uniref:hypothetical protein n=1 Tax=Morganella morganii TaxID=582 RepID=UPI001BD9BE2B|nr:hypothetical protein [Morganella morganii]MBT0380248.1 hypothetical protein [Morganella morganii subsp. morganii]HDU8608504.1 hypothetical protein [Morganella morganii]
MRDFTHEQLDAWFGHIQQSSTCLGGSIDGTDYRISGGTMPDSKRFITITDSANVNDSITYESDNNGFWEKIPNRLI